jgi:hypothetical protein
MSYRIKNKTLVEAPPPYDEEALQASVAKQVDGRGTELAPALK